ncbi:hypothetical protein L226DRAFT_601246, partial [Lentinus tigrinus ALCF2SS1-7]|uniref:uncharacterized protein n=1 Tax=Lentinus tigrinus ALCF2SS1-7 TaxID=1328758 RepID=UPI00116611C1
WVDEVRTLSEEERVEFERQIVPVKLVLAKVRKLAYKIVNSPTILLPAWRELCREARTARQTHPSRCANTLEFNLRHGPRYLRLQECISPHYVQQGFGSPRVRIECPRVEHSQAAARCVEGSSSAHLRFSSRTAAAREFVVDNRGAFARCIVTWRWDDRHRRWWRCRIIRVVSPLIRQLWHVRDVLWGLVRSVRVTRDVNVVERQAKDVDERRVAREAAFVKDRMRRNDEFLRGRIPEPPGLGALRIANKDALARVRFKRLLV